MAAQHDHWDFAGALQCRCGFESESTEGDAKVCEWSDHLAAVLVAELRPEIISVEELDALPEESVINDAHGCTAKKFRDAWWWIATHEPCEPDLPAILLYRREDGAQ